MNKSLFILILSSFTLFHYQSANIVLVNKPFFKFKAQKKPKDKIERYGKEKIAFSVAVNTGYKRLLSKEQRQRYKDLNLLHLFTPSGLHLLPLSIIMRNILSRPANIFLNIALYIFFFNTGFFWSIRRILFLRICFTFLENRSLNFLLCFLFDFFIGGYSESPLSFTFSYLFLGCVLLSNNKKEFYISISIAQLITAYFFQSDYYLITPVISIFLSSLFSVIFIFSFLNHWVFYSLHTPLFLNFINVFYDSFVSIAHHFLLLSPKLSIELNIISLAVLLLFNFKRLSIVLIILTSSYLNPQKIYKSQSKTYYSKAI